MTGIVQMLSLRLHAQCPECGEYRGNSVMQNSEGRIILLCDHHREEQTDGKARQTGQPDTSTA